MTEEREGNWVHIHKHSLRVEEVLEYILDLVHEKYKNMDGNSKWLKE